ncbi:helix-turn-helix domain-containing protein [Flavobacterium branchiophilum]|uniref:DNA-binding protein n=1 Tax=Flavobacterium branchiophilum TaxID=55197 RepID=A0A2H3KF13_9FLAO|nr:helix-turn-helix transcriptional regulator [Flavobacterium branchiophilum]PDS25641.1 DNA-binding protein [Flavobacterium branchiophilum]
MGKKLKALKAAKGYSTDEIAEMLEISKSTYGRYERNESTPDLKTLEKIAQIYNIEPHELLSQEHFTLKQKIKKGHNNGVIFNQMSEKLIESLEQRIAEKDAIINDLRALVQELKR